MTNRATALAPQPSDIPHAGSAAVVDLPVPGAFVRRLGEGPAAAVADVGGKAAGLDRLLRMAANTPPAFCLTAHALRHHLAANGLADESDEDGRAARVRCCEAKPLPADLADALARNVDALLAGSPSALLAVRSSALGEDGADASFAGRHATVLGVTRDSVEAAVRTCWSSLWSSAAVAYRRRRGLALGGLGMAVVVQRLVPAEAAAVAFTRHPVLGDDGQVWVNVTRGLGEPLVSGAVSGDTIVVDKATLELLSIQEGTKSVRVDALPDGGLRATEASRPGLAVRATTVKTLVSTCLEIEAAYGSPVDVEAAYTAGTWHIVQSRAVTA
jgi:pyruvate,water dikinase